MEILKVSSKSNPNSVAGAIVGFVKENGCVEIQVIGGGAVNQTMKSIAIARGFIAPAGKNLVCIPSFVEVDVEGKIKTGMRFLVKEEN